MRDLKAFIYKECIEVTRNGKLLIIGIVFFLFGIMNPAIAKLTPWLMENYAGSLEEAGFIITEITVDAMSSWTQFYKNVPMALIVFLLMFSGCLVSEYQRGTLINIITKGLSRWKILTAKTIVIFALWSLSYWMCYGITYGYNAYFWDNSIAKNLLFGAFCIYVLGIWLISLMLLMSVIFNSSAGVTIGVGVVFFVSYMLSIIPDLQKYLPTYLGSSSSLLTGATKVSDYSYALLIVAGLTVAQSIMSYVLFNKKQL